MRDDPHSAVALPGDTHSAELTRHPRVVHAYLDAPQTVIAKLTVPLTLPLKTSTVTVTDQNTGTVIRVVALDLGYSFHATIIGDLQRLAGARGDWNTEDETTLLKAVHPNLYQYSVRLPAGTYNYKVAIDGSFTNTLPSNNVRFTVPDEGAKVTFSFVPYNVSTHRAEVYDSINNPGALLPVSSAGVSTDLIALTLEQAPDVTHNLLLTLGVLGQCAVIPRNVLNDAQYFYHGDDLGNVYMPAASSFRVWAPTASAVQLLLFNSETGPLTATTAMQRGEGGTWYVQVPGDYKDWYYLYRVTVHGSTQTAVDPYVKALAVNATRGMIVDLAATDPAGWETDRRVTLTHPVDAVIYELHVRDFSIDDDSGTVHKGKFLAFTERGTKGPHGIATGVDSLKELGITHVQVLPVQEFASVDENDPRQYNWGYDPRNYNVPEGAYATTPHGTARITEFKQMVQALHQAQIGVIMDVVYNHTFTMFASDFDKLVPRYYYRTDAFGQYTNGSGTGNELATEHPMVQKFVCDSVTYWVREYHVDGYRFDLMALIGVATMRLIAQDLHAIDPQILVYGEPWAGGGSALPEGQLLNKGRQRGLQVGVFNDTIRNSLDGNTFDAASQGFATGETDLVDVIKCCVVGSIDDFTDAPGETINYVSSHDNYTLWDKIALSNPEDTEADRIKMDELAQAVVMTSQGVPFMQGGEEFLRTKGGNSNSYNAGDAVNYFDWSRKMQYHDVFTYYAGLIHLRNNHPAFRMTSAEAIRNRLAFLASPENTVAFALLEHVNGDSWKHIIVIYNPNKTEEEVNLPDGAWHIVATQGRVGGDEDILGHAVEKVSVPAISCMILYQN